MSDLYVVEASGGGYLLPDHYPTADILKAGTWPKEMAESLASEKSKRHAVPIEKAWAQWAHHHAPADPRHTVMAWLTMDDEASPT